MPHVPPSSATSSTSRRGMDEFAVKYLLSCSAALVAETATYPLDITKTRLQVQAQTGDGGLAWRTRGGMLRVTYDIARREGLSSLWSGVAPAVYRHFVYTGIRMPGYELMRLKLTEDGKRPFGLLQSMFCGLISGAVAQFAASPADLVKVQMQMEGIRRLQRLPPRFDSTWHAFRILYRQNGFYGLWVGWVPNCQRAGLVNMADLATYDRVKHWLLRHTTMEDNALTHACSSACSGLAAATVSTPADVVKTRIMDQLRHMHDHDTARVENAYVYKGSIDCLRHTVRTEGFFALYKGFVPIYVRMAPWSLTFWVSYEKIRYVTGASSF